MTDDRRLPFDVGPNWRPEPQPFAAGDRVYIRRRNITGSLIAARTLGSPPHEVRQLLVETDIGARLWFRPEEVERLVEGAAPVKTLAERLRGRPFLRLAAVGGERV